MGYCQLLRKHTFGISVGYGPLPTHGKDACVQAGLLIAETEFALQVESDIAPYKGLLMGLFFMTVGMEISVGLFFGKIRTVIAGILGLLIGKVCPCAPTKYYNQS